MLKEISEQLTSNDIASVDRGLQELEVFCNGDLDQITQVLGTISLDDDCIEYQESSLLFDCDHDEYIALWALCQFVKQGALTCSELMLMGEYQHLPNDVIHVPLVLLDMSCTDLADVPVAIRQLHQLEELDIGENNLTSLPDWLVELKNLRVLHIEGNHFAVFPDVILQLPALEELWLGEVDPATLPIDLESRIASLFMTPITTGKTFGSKEEYDSSDEERPFLEREESMDRESRGGGFFFLGAALLIGMVIYLLLSSGG